MSYRIVVANRSNDVFLYSSAEKALRKVRTLQRRALEFTIFDERMHKRLSVEQLEELADTE